MSDQGRITTLTVESDALRGNPLGDPHVRRHSVWLPPSWDDDSDRRFPAILHLVGFTGTGHMALHDSPWKPGLQTRLDRLVAAGDMPECVVVMPDCWTRLGGSQYLDSAATGAYETHLMKEVLPAADEELRTNGDWAVMGKSSGGYGTLRLAMRNPGRFRAAACHSGDMAFEYGYLPDFPKLIAALEEAGGVEEFVDAFDERDKKRGKDIGAINILAMAACYSPDTSEPLNIRLPFDLPTGRIRDDVWREWLTHDPVRMLDDESCVAALRDLDLLFLDCGVRDEFNLHLGMRQFCERLDELGVEHRAEEFDDGHMSINYRYDVSLPLLGAALAPGA